MAHQDEIDEVSTNHRPPEDQLRCLYIELLHRSLLSTSRSTSKVSVLVDDVFVSFYAMKMERTKKTFISFVPGTQLIELANTIELPSFKTMYFVEKSNKI